MNYLNSIYCMHKYIHKYSIYVSTPISMAAATNTPICTKVVEVRATPPEDQADEFSVANDSVSDRQSLPLRVYMARLENQKTHVGESQCLAAPRITLL